MEVKSNLKNLRGTLAIDLGSTTTVVAFQAENSSSLNLIDLAPISRAPGEVPSLLWKSSNAESDLLFGQEIENLNPRERVKPNLISDFKRWIGVSEKDIPIKYSLKPEKAGELFIKEIWKRIPPELEIKKLVLSLPVETYKEYRKWLHSVCNEFDVEEIALVDEPTAAAIGAGQQGGSKILVIDIGGSTIDMSMVQLEGGEGQAEPIAQLVRFKGEDLEGKSKQVVRGAKVLGKAGIRLGGRDFDKWILHYLYPNIEQTELLLNSAEKLKCRLSNLEVNDNERLTEKVLLGDIDNDELDILKLSRIEFEDLLKKKNLFKILSRLLEKTLARGSAQGCEEEDLSGVILVGGGSRIPAIKKWLLMNFKEDKVITPPPIEAVAKGALKLTPGVTIRDVLNQGAALRFWDQKTNKHIWHPLFFPGQPWPTTKPLEIIISASTKDQKEIEIRIADQEENSMQEVIYSNGIPIIKDVKYSSNSKLTPWLEKPLNIKLNPPGEAGLECLKLFFTIDDLCQLNIEVIDLRSQKKIIKEILGLMK